MKKRYNKYINKSYNIKDVIHLPSDTELVFRAVLNTTTRTDKNCVIGAFSSFNIKKC